MNDYCLILAKKFRKYEQSLVVHSINKQQFNEALSQIGQLQEKQLRIDSILKFGGVLINHQPLQYLTMLKSPDFEEVDKNQLVPILLQAPKKAIKQTAELVTKYWIQQRSIKERYIYNLAFHLLVQSILACETSEEVSQ